MSVKIRMKRMGRKHRSFFRICATDTRSPRDGKVLEELGTYDPLIPDTDARVTLDGDRVEYWLGVGAQPSEKVRVLIKKYGKNGTRRVEAEAAREKLSLPKPVPPAPTPVELPTKAGTVEAAATPDADSGDAALPADTPEGESAEQ